MWAKLELPHLFRQPTARKLGSQPGDEGPVGMGKHGGRSVVAANRQLRQLRLLCRGQAALLLPARWLLRLLLLAV